MLHVRERGEAPISLDRLPYSLLSLFDIIANIVIVPLLRLLLLSFLSLPRCLAWIASEGLGFTERLVCISMCVCVFVCVYMSLYACMSVCLCACAN